MEKWSKILQTVLKNDFDEAYYPYPKEAESGYVEAQTDKEYFGWMNGKASEISGFFFGFPGIQNALKTSGFGAEPQEHVLSVKF